MGMSFYGCTTVQETQEFSPEIAQIEKLAFQNESLREKIKQLEKTVADKDALIKSLYIRERDQSQVLQATSNEVVRTQARLNRLATKPASASQIAEAEVLMARIKPQLTHPSDQRLLEQAKRLVDTAISYYKQDDYAAAMNYASQTIEFVNMLTDQNRTRSKHSLVAFNVPVNIKVIIDANLRRKSGIDGEIIGVLQEGTILKALAYQRNWLRVQTDDENQGWISNKLIEAFVN